MPKRMVNIRTTEVSGVDRAANLTEGWMVMKSLDPTSADLLMKAAGINPDHNMEIPMPTLPEEVRKGLDPSAVSYIESLEAQVQKGAGTGTPTDTSLTPEQEMEKALASLPEPLRKSYLATQREAAEARDFAKAAQAREELSHYVSIAKALTKVPTDGNTDEFGETLRKAAHGDEDAFGLVLKALNASNAALEQSAMFKSLGSDTAPSADSATGQLTAIAKSYIADGSATDMDEAFHKAVGDNPHLYAGYRRESQNTGGN